MRSSPRPRANLPTRPCDLSRSARIALAADVAREVVGMVARLDEAFAVLVDILDRHGGIVNKFLGDGFLALFDGPARAIRCALAIRAAVRRLGLEVRAGLHTGEVERGIELVALRRWRRIGRRRGRDDLIPGQPVRAQHLRRHPGGDGALVVEIATEATEDRYQLAAFGFAQFRRVGACQSLHGSPASGAASGGSRGRETLACRALNMCAGRALPFSLKSPPELTPPQNTGPLPVPAGAALFRGPATMAESPVPRERF